MSLQRKYQSDSLDRVENFITVNAVALGLLATSEAAQQVQAAVAAYRTQVNVGGTANLAMAGQLARERSLTVALRDQHMKPISGFARTRLKGVPDVAALTKGAAHLTGRSLVEAAQAMATAAAPHLDALVTGGFPPDVLTQLGAAATALTTALTDRANTKVARVGATSGQKQALRNGLDAVRMLDAVITRQFAGNDTLLASWRTAKRVVSKPGVVSAPAAPTGAAPVPAASPAAPVATATPVTQTPEVKAS